MEPVIDTPSGRTVLEVKNLHVQVRGRDPALADLRDISIDLKAGEFAALFDEAGSAGATLALAVAGLLTADAIGAASGSVRLGESEYVLGTPWRRHRIPARDIAAIGPAPGNGHRHLLDPRRTIAKQMARRIQTHLPVDRAEAALIAEQLLRDMGVAGAKAVMAAYPDSLASHARWRVIVAMAFVADPRVIVAHDPGAGLDAAAHLQILLLLKAKAVQTGASVLLMGRDLPLLANICDRVHVLFQGRIVEAAPAEDLLHEPSHPYTRALLAARPGSRRARHPRPLAASPEDAAAAPPGDGAPEASAPRPLLQARDVHFGYPVAWNWRGRPSAWKSAVRGVSLVLERGQTLGIIGRQGCGKSSLGRLLAGLEAPATGTVRHGGVRAGKAEGRATAVPYVSSDPRPTISPAMPVWRAMTEPLARLEGGSAKARRARAEELLLLVGLGPEIMAVRTRDLTRPVLQRLAIGRALSLDSPCLILDEPTADLGALEQAGILKLLLDLQSGRRLAYVLLSRSPGIVRHMADRVAVMHRGQIVESGPARVVMDNPRHPFARLWLAIDPGSGAAFNPEAAFDLGAAGGAAAGSGPGCGFASQCPWRGEGCDEAQELREMEDSGPRRVRCHRAAAGEGMPFGGAG